MGKLNLQWPDLTWPLIICVWCLTLQARWETCCVWSCDGRNGHRTENGEPWKQVGKTKGESNYFGLWRTCIAAILYCNLRFPFGAEDYYGFWALDMIMPETVHSFRILASWIIEYSVDLLKVLEDYARLLEGVLQSERTPVHDINLACVASHGLKDCLQEIAA